MTYRRMAAMYAGKCSLCGEKIAVGSPILYGAGKARHEACVPTQAPAPAPVQTPAPAPVAPVAVAVAVAAAAVVVTPSSGSVAMAPVVRRPAGSLARRIAYLNAKGIPIGPMSTDSQVQEWAPRIQAAREALLAGEGDYTPELRADMAGDLEILLRRLPSARVTDANAGIAPELRAAAVEVSAMRARAEKRAAKALGSDTGYVAVADGQTAGAYVWRTASGEVNLDALAAAWAEAGLSDTLLPSEPTLNQVCRRALDKARRGKGERVTIEPLVRGYEWAVTVKTVENTGAGGAALPGKPETLLVATVKGGETEFRDVSERGAALVPEIKAALLSGAGILGRAAMSNWITLLFSKLGGLRLREEGGFYYVPPAAAETIAKVKALLEKVSAFRVMRTPITKCADVTEAVLGGFRIEFKTWRDAFEAALLKGEGGRALENLEVEGLTLKAKVTGMEQMLGVTLGDLHQELAVMRNAVTARAIEIAGHRLAAAPAADAESRRIASIVGEQAVEAKGVIVAAAPEAVTPDARFAGALAEAQRADKAPAPAPEAPAAPAPVVPAPVAVQAAPAAPAPCLVPAEGLCARACAKYGPVTGIMRYLGFVLAAVAPAVLADREEENVKASGRGAIETDDRTGAKEAQSIARDWKPAPEGDDEAPVRRIDLN